MIRSRFVHKVPLIVFALDLALVLSLFIAPLTIEKGEVIGLDGRANALDYTEKWKELNPFASIVYLFGDYNCHQREERSMVLNGNQLPVCARDVAIFTGILLGAALLVRASADDDPSLTVLGQLPKKWRRGIIMKRPLLSLVILLVLLLVPTAIDGGVQLMSGLGLLPFGLTYESTNPTRVLTGFPTGVAAGLLVTSLLMSLGSRRDGGQLALIKYLFMRTRTVLKEGNDDRGEGSNGR